MTTAAFIDYLTEEYRGDTAAFWKHMMADNSEEMLMQPVTKKKAALILHAMMRDSLDIKDVDWDKARKLKDIYDCRICANAVAQVIERGLIEPEKPDLFGMQIPMEDEELLSAVKKLII
ncbi:hypothetical protein [Butyrivibrio sp. INlla16]|uniref:hypothetical protein n=1 Tax=Butyrivibrio sp. INlla16 TaxID=1520807 RepID=UPI00088B08B6|nr:hypothetical protein [Butyrivibrio sp. INlla16]SDB59542.1 hypothetical protein SAMN02910263_03102 [Butyrivibrio sp. INlla16]